MSRTSKFFIEVNFEMGFDIITIEILWSSFTVVIFFIFCLMIIIFFVILN